MREQAKGYDRKWIPGREKSEVKGPETGISVM